MQAAQPTKYRITLGSTEKVELQTKVRGNKGKMKGNKQKIIPKREKM